jgi:glycosyltransferase involved in cell wall biosynthesis
VGVSTSEISPLEFRAGETATVRGPQPAPLQDAPLPAASRSLRILMVVESSAGGTGRQVLDLSDGLMQRGCEVHMIYSTNRIDRLFIERLDELPNLRRMGRFLRTGIHPSDLTAVLAVRQYMNEFGPFDIIHGHSSKGGALARLAAIGKGLPVIYTLHGFIIMDPGMAPLHRLFYLNIERLLSMRTARIIAVSPEESRAAVRWGLGKERVVFVPNGVGPPRLVSRPAARRELGVSDDAVVIGFVGRLVAQKAPAVLLRAFAATTRIVPQARLAMVGAGPLGDAMRNLAAELGVGDKILWLGERDARGVLAGFDIFALSSRKEGLPYVVLEAMATGLPIVATSSAGVEALVESGVNGAVVPPDDSTAFGRALIALAANPVRLAEQGAASRRRAAEFTIDKMVEGTLAAYLSCCRGGRENR